MTTLLLLRHANGHRRQCDARCYNGKPGRCTCVCGGANHGKGHAAAVAQTRELGQDWLDRARAQAGDPEGRGKFGRDVAQPEIFPREYATEES